MSTPQAQFYHNAENPLLLTCELVSRAYAGRRKVAIRTTDFSMAQQLDQLLWTFNQHGFIPHVMADSKLAHETPVVITSQQNTVCPHQDILFNLAQEIPPDFARFRLLVEVIGQHEKDKLPGRIRWSHYKAAGLNLQAFDAVHRVPL